MPFYTGGVNLDDFFFTGIDLVDQYATISGPLYLWGRNYPPNLGDGTYDSRNSPVQTIALGSNWLQVSCGYNHTAAIKTDGTLWMWGQNSYGQLGTPPSGVVNSPIQTSGGGTNWSQVGLGAWFTTAIKTDGTLWTWGMNQYGQLGNNNRNQYSSPAQTISGGTNWKQVAAGYQICAAIKTDGTLWTWGLGTSGQLGNNAGASRSSPAQTIAGGTNWKQVECGWRCMAAIKSDGTLWCWGSNNVGQLGDNTTIDKSSPVQTIAGGTNWKQVACSAHAMAAVKSDGTLWCWGLGASGKLGDNTIVSKSSPVQTIAGGTNWKQVACTPVYFQQYMEPTDGHTAAIKTDGTLWLWGGGGYALGGGASSAGSSSSPVQTIMRGNFWKQVSCNNQQTAAVINGVLL